ncbi:SDR family oxidoreductase [Mesorhizobium sp. RSR565B]
MEAFTRAGWLKVLSVDLLGAIYFAGKAFAHMTSGGVIVKHIECARSRRAPHVELYAAAKATLLSLTETRRSSHLGRLGMNPDDYRTKWNLPRNYPMVAPNYSGSVPHIASNTQ